MTKKVLALVSGGIDSPVAAYLVGRLRGVETECVFFDTSPYMDSRGKKRAEKNIRLLSEKINLRGFWVAPHGKNLSEFIQKCEAKYTCVFCKRTMLRSARILAEETRAVALVTGESLGQVASQTMANISAENPAVSMPVLRPLIGLDKEEVVSVAKKIGTYEVSIQRASCCKAVPKSPCTNCALGKILGEEKKLDLESLLEQTVAEAEYLDLSADR